MNYYLGIDGGGTKTAALIMDGEGCELGRGLGGSGSLTTNNDRKLRQALRDALQDALLKCDLPSTTHFKGVCAGMAGFSVEDRLASFQNILREEVSADAYHVEPDYIVAYWGATHGEPGIVVIAGTGAVAYGRNSEGKSHTEDGLGFLLGDRGSGFNLGVRVLRYTLDEMKAGRSDDLTEAVIENTGAKTQNQMMQWLYGDFSPARVAGLAPVVGELAEQGNIPARSQVAEMARRLRHTVRHVRHSIWLPRDTPVYPLGGLWQLGTFFQEEFIDPQWRGEGRFVQEQETLAGGRFVIAEPKSDAVFGAALMARLLP